MSTTKLHALLPFLTFFAGCAQVGTPQITARVTSPTVEVCGTSIQFVSLPRVMTAVEMKPFIEGVGNYAKWDTKGWFADQYRYSEGAICACRDYPFTEDEFAARKDSVGSNADFLEFQQRVIPAVGASFQFQAPGSTVAATSRVQVVRPTQASSCVLVQFTQMPQSDPRRNDFFNRLAPLASSRSDIAVGTPAERLRVLESLLAEGLITVDDYNARKKVIVNGL